MGHKERKLFKRLQLRRYRENGLTTKLNNQNTNNPVPWEIDKRKAMKHIFLAGRIKKMPYF